MRRLSCVGGAGDRREEVDDPVVEQHQAAEDRQGGQHDQRDGHHLRRLVRVDALRPALLGEEGHQHQPGHVEAGDAGAEHGQHADQPVLGQGGLDDLVLGPEAGEAREPDDREVAHRERQERDRHGLAQRAVVAHVDVVVHPVHHRAGAEEHVGLEEAVGEQVEDRERRSRRRRARRRASCSRSGSSSTRPATFLMSSLAHPMIAPHSSVTTRDDDDGGPGVRRVARR